MANRSFLLVLACVLMLAGCTSVRTIDLTRATDDAFYELNAEAQRREARITLVGWPPLSASEVQVGVDSTSWREARTGRRRSVPTSQISEIRFRKNRLWRGAMVGAAFGVGAALALGADCSGRPEDETCISRGDLVPMSILLGGVLGGIIGSRGSQRYRFETPPRRPSVTRQQ